MIAARAGQPSRTGNPSPGRAAESACQWRGPADHSRAEHPGGMAASSVAAAAAPTSQSLLAPPAPGTRARTHANTHARARTHTHTHARTVIARAGLGGAGGVGGWGGG